MIDQTDDKSETTPSGMSRWQLPLINMLIILLAVCIVLLTMSRLDGLRLAEALASIRTAFGLEALSTSFAGEGRGGGESTHKMAELMEFEQAVELVRIKEKLAVMHASMAPGQDPPEVKPVDEGFLIRLSRAALFVDGAITIRPEVEPLLKQLSQMLARLPNMIRIDSHAGDKPSASAVTITSVWAQTAAEAATLADYFVTTGGLDPKRVLPSGHRVGREGSGRTGEKRAARIDILLTREIRVASAS
ncbi:MAG: hypothetical protein G8237_01530 [Magnetococcales bacterium]|nr:hypothetical protein [Magnetococcales bacterium]NGZ05018.1 hypothetical protein [Magnetococcales bacterium]